MLGGLDRAMEGVNVTGTGLRFLDEVILNRSRVPIEEHLAGHPQIAARLEHTVGTTYRNTGTDRESGAAPATGHGALRTGAGPGPSGAGAWLVQGEHFQGSKPRRITRRPGVRCNRRRGERAPSEVASRVAWAKGFSRACYATSGDSIRRVALNCRKGPPASFLCSPCRPSAPSS